MQTRRQEILTILKQKGEATVDELATILDLTPVTVRHHLDILRAEGLVQTSSVRRRHGPGRPQYVYTLTPSAADHFPQNYDILVNELLDEMKARLKDDTIEKIFDGIADRRLSHAPSLPADMPMDERMTKLADYMNNEGYIASPEQRDGNWFLVISNCPYHNVATLHPELCNVDLTLVQELAGVQVICHQRITEGSHACLYQISADE